MIKVLITIVLIFVSCQAQVTSRPFRVATDPSSPPFEFLQNGSTNPIGFDIDLISVATISLAYQIVQLPWANLFEQVRDHQVDFAGSGITINDVRKQTYDFSVPYFLSTHKILAKQGTDITSAQDLLNKIVSVRDETTGAVAVEKIFGGDNSAILKFPTQDEAIQAVIDGRADAYVDDNALLEYYANNNPGFVVIADPDAFEKEFYGYMFPKGSDTVDLVNIDITWGLENGEYTRIYKKWFGTDPDVDLLLAAGKAEDPYDVFNEIQEEGANEEETEIEIEIEIDVIWEEMLL